MVANTREKKDAGVDAKGGTALHSIHKAVLSKSASFNLLIPPFSGMK